MQFDIKKCQPIFKQADTKNKGFLSMDQLFYAITRLLRIQINMATLEIIMTLTDENNDGVTQEDEFCHIVYICENADLRDTQSILFYAADNDYSGTIEKSELFNVSKKLGIETNELELFAMMSVLTGTQTDEQSLNYDMFEHIMDILIKRNNKQNKQYEDILIDKIQQRQHVINLKNNSVSFI
ncbi:EF_hand domain-containing protein [Hexamita inflata]|uniref:EF hand domain-containing protein n=1 Tax=Hexamita inflata TaxID=28002 RepID=A0AA86UFR2_9EUKA|nr:EF hand domain-containing protein [Hexamita inflata]CAI9969298.1 EF hand domain-containing protein [Hexamita inflata]